MATRSSQERGSMKTLSAVGSDGQRISVGIANALSCAQGRHWREVEARDACDGWAVEHGTIKDLAGYSSSAGTWPQPTMLQPRPAPHHTWQQRKCAGARVERGCPFSATPHVTQSGKLRCIATRFRQLRPVTNATSCHRRRRARRCCATVQRLANTHDGFRVCVSAATMVHRPTPLSRCFPWLTKRSRLFRPSISSPRRMSTSRLTPPRSFRRVQQLLCAPRSPF